MRAPARDCSPPLSRAEERGPTLTVDAATPLFVEADANLLRHALVNLIEIALSVVRTATQRAKRWRPGDMRLRWSAAGLLAGEKRFRRVRGYKSMGALIANVKVFDAKRASKSEAA